MINILRRLGAVALIAAMSTTVLAGCAQTQAAKGKAKVILIGDQAFGDHGPMDDMAAALDGCGSKQGLQTKKVVALSPSEYLSDINSAAAQGYSLIITTFPEMTPATVAAAKAHPNVKFAAVYQLINDQGTANVPNVWDTSFDINAVSYVQGVLAAKLSKTHKLGYVVGDLDPTIAGALNAFMQGAHSADAAANVLWANANTFGDPAKGKDLAQGMISQGADVLSTQAAQTQLGVLDAAKSAGALFFGDDGDNSSSYPNGFVSDSRSELGKSVATACADFAAGSLKAGHHTVYDLSNGGADLDTALVTKWGQASGRTQEAAQLLGTLGQLSGDIASGRVKVVNDPNPPSQ